MSRRSVRSKRYWLLVGAWVLAMPGLAWTQSAPPPPPPTSPPTPPPPPGGTIRILRGGSSDPVFIDFVTRVSNRAPRKFADEPMPVPPDNPITEAKAALGRRLFFDPLLSIDRSVSCATCHDPDRAFADDRALAVGVFGRIGKRHSPALVNRGYGRAHFWDGRSTSLESQVLLPVVDPNEMAMTLEELESRLKKDESYAAAFQAAFDRPMTLDDVRRALATFLRTVKSSDAPYDRFVAGDAGALSAEAQAGLTLFRGRAFCAVCHREPTFTDEAFHNTGVAFRPDTATFADEGRFDVSGNPRDRGKFKTPTLREIARTAPYMHDGSLKTLEEVVEFYNNGGRPNGNLFPVIRPLGLSAQDKAALVAFLESLSGTVSGR
jgi:cytochrome c peroxidase